MAGSRRDTPNDPGRRDRILDAALDVIADAGVHRASHRRIAARAGVPLGSLTYYFGGLDDLIAQAFARLAETMSGSYRSALEGAGSPAEAESAVVDLICSPEYVGRRELALLHELYAYSNHHPVVAELLQSWQRESSAALGLHFPPGTGDALDALIEGWPMHHAASGTRPDRLVVAAAVSAIVAGAG